MSEENKEVEVDLTEEVTEAQASLNDLLLNTGVSLTNLDWSADRKKMTIELALTDKEEDKSSTYAFLENLSNFTADDLTRAIAEDLVNKIKLQEAKNSSPETSDADEEE